MYRIGVDVGGTFTDCVCITPAGEPITAPVITSGTTALRKPASPSALTRARQAASTSSCGKPASVASAKRVIAAAKRPTVNTVGRLDA